MECEMSRLEFKENKTSEFFTLVDENGDFLYDYNRKTYLIYNNTKELMSVISKSISSRIKDYGYDFEGEHYSSDYHSMRNETKKLTKELLHKFVAIELSKLKIVKLEIK
jgi:hypothetical protein